MPIHVAPVTGPYNNIWSPLDDAADEAEELEARYGTEWLYQQQTADAADPAAWTDEEWAEYEAWREAQPAEPAMTEDGTDWETF